MLRHPIVRYGLALAVVGVAGLLRGVLGAQFPGLVPFATFFPAVLIATLLGGLGPGLLATGLSALWAWLLWLQPSVALAPPAASMTVNLMLFVVVCVGLVATAEAARRYHDRSLAGERRFRAAGELALDGFGILAAVRDRQGAIVDFRWSYANPAMAKLLRMPGDPVGRRLLEDLPGHRSPPALFPSYVQVVETGQPVTAEVRYDADGIRGWWRTSVVKLEDGVAVSLRDITSRKEREAALQDSEERFRLLAEALDDVFWISDVRRQRVIYVSPAYERVWGSSQEQLYRDPKAWRRNVHPADRAEVDAVFDQMMAGQRQSFEVVYRVRAPKGTRWVRDKAWLVGAPGGERVAGIMTDITAEKAAEEKQRLLSQELGHRLKNSFALMQSIVRLSARGATDLGAFVESLEARIRALARGQDVLVGDSGESADLGEMIRGILALHDGSADRVRIQGPTVHLAASAMPLFNMAFHELATNATKYGALSVPGGEVSVRWRSQAAEGGQVLLLRWQESGGPAVEPPQRRGFGSMLIEQALAAEFGGPIELAFPPEGVICTMRLPLTERLRVRSDAA
jgi:PAS domain S-box-containing protein